MIGQMIKLRKLIGLNCEFGTNGIAINGPVTWKSRLEEDGLVKSTPYCSKLLTTNESSVSIGYGSIGVYWCSDDSCRKLLLC